MSSIEEKISKAFYLDDDENFTLRVSSSSGDGTVGATGIQGIQGETGIQGEIGEDGETGPIGLTGDAGEQGVTGLQGLTGDVGATGIGLQGVTGLEGLSGPQGDIGETGIQGIRGVTGIGSIGDTGIQGIQGDTGPIGATGETGLDLTAEVAILEAMNIDKDNPHGFIRNDQDNMGILEFSNGISTVGRIDEASLFSALATTTYYDGTSISARTFRISPKIGNTINFYNEVVKYELTEGQSITIPDVSGLYIIYFNDLNDLHYTQGTPANLIDVMHNGVIVSLVYWSVEEQEVIYFADERHGIDPVEHERLHFTDGAKYSYGMDISGLSAGSNVFTSMSLGSLWDEDINKLLASSATMPSFYLHHNGTSNVWRATTANNEITHMGPSYVYYNPENAGEYSLVEQTGINYLIYFMIGSNNARYPYIKLIGQNLYSTIGEARVAISSEFSKMSLAGLPAAEKVPVCAYIINRNGELVLDDLGNTHVDLRSSSSTGSGTTSSTSFSALLDTPASYTGSNGRLVAVKDDLTGLEFTTNIKEIDYIDFDITAAETDAVGKLKWNEDEGTLDLGLIGGNVNLQLGQEQVYYVKNQTGATIINGSSVRAIGTLGASGRLLIGEALANGTYLSRYNIGIATEDIPNGESGFVTSFGKVRGLNTTGALQGETWVDGDILYVSPISAGDLTNIPPTSPDQTIIVAIVVLAHISAGALFVRVDTGESLNDLHDVYHNGLSDGDVIQYNSTNSRWENTPLASLQGETGVMGLQGIQGETGIIGLTGDIGETGLQGIQGLTGIQGITGLIGETGIQGFTGLGVTGPAGADGGGGSGGLTITSQSASYTFDIDDADTLVIQTSASATNFTIPPNSSVAYTVGTQITMMQQGVGVLTVVAGAGVTLQTEEGLILNDQYSSCVAIKLATDTWGIFGSMRLS